MKRLTLISISIFLLTKITYSQDIINETGKDGKFIVRDAEQKEALIIENGNVSLTGELKINTMTEGDDTDDMVVWDKDDKNLNVVPRVFSKVSPLSEKLDTGIGHSIIRGNPLDEDGNEISSSVQGIAAVIWNQFDTDYGYIKFGPSNPYGAHIYSSGQKFMFNKEIRVLNGRIGSHNTDLYLKIKGRTKVIIDKDNGNVGIGDNTPTYKLDVAGKIGINDTQILYLPDQTSFEGSIILGDGGNNLTAGGAWNGQHNIAIGMGALEETTSGYDNVFIGQIAGQKNTEGHENTFIGWGAGSRNTLGNWNAFYGNASGFKNTTGIDNVFIGSFSGGANTEGHSNTYIGRSAGSTSLGFWNTYIGYAAGSENVNGNYNTFIGNNAGSLSTGSDNVFIGESAGQSQTGSGLLFINNSGGNPLIGGDFNTDRVGINTADPAVTFEVSGTDAVLLASGTTAERPSTPTAGMIRFNSTTSKFEGYTGSAWVDLH